MASNTSIHPRREARLAQWLVGRIPEVGLLSREVTGALGKQVVERLALPEVTPSPTTPTAADVWNRLHGPWLWLSRQKNHTNEGQRSTLDRLQRYALLPWCLGLETPDRHERVWECVWLLQEAVLIWELHVALEGELLDLLAFDDFRQRHPSAAIADLFRVDLPTVMLQPAWNDSMGPWGPRPWQAVQARLTEEARAAMWSMVWLDAPALPLGKLPSPWRLGSLDGKLWWEHWQELYQQLETAVGEGATPSTRASVAESTAGDEAPASGKEVEERGGVGNQLSVSPVEDIPGAALLPIRSFDDPRLADALQSQLSVCRERGSSMTLAVVDDGVSAERNASRGSSSMSGRDSWQSIFLHQLFDISEGRVGERGFLSDDGALVIVVEGMDRSEVTTLVREAIQGTCQAWFGDAAASPSAPLPGTLYAGISSVVIPNKRFRFEPLQQAAWRCLEAARKQGPGAVKSLEVF